MASYRFLSADYKKNYIYRISLWLIILNDLVYVVHTEKPRCIIQCDLDGFYSNQKIYWIDEEPLSQDDIDSLMEEAEDFYETELDNQEEVYDEEEDN